ncbi:3-oxoacyl-(acyl-carrier-protein) reductase [Rhodopirellula maiorica SM1]|uniref:3-oxoacyl-(Acyl-carrier-protein) reductase n=1 Tax=Rhodopirellula maiorica SM1 TaxID=1265738 RepID=M5RJX8_9BACT|nr:SDR family oxidoreductase [Rhodopirellula maiorica]EMI15682.1 3-oxoacyl-(acyl-carrier-protein) reductase [Rhodopirellula maiorica SM1]
MNDKTFLILGGSHGIGFGITERLLRRGGSVVVISRTRGQLDDLDPSLAANLTHHAADVTTDAIDTVALPDRIDAMAYCVGSIGLSPLRMTKAESMRQDFELNVIGAMRVMQRALPAMKAAESSSVVLFSTVAVGRGLAMHTSVSAAKGAVEGIARCWAAELAPHVRVNCIAPALTDTPLSERLLSSDAKRDAMAAVYPLGRIGHVNDCASMATFLLSDESSWITGQVIGVDGGLSRVQK